MCVCFAVGTGIQWSVGYNCGGSSHREVPVEPDLVRTDGLSAGGENGVEGKAQWLWGGRLREEEWGLPAGLWDCINESLWTLDPSLPSLSLSLRWWFAGLAILSPLTSLIEGWVWSETSLRDEDVIIISNRLFTCCIFSYTHHFLLIAFLLF